MSGSRTKGEFVALARVAAFVRFPDLHSGLHTSCRLPVGSTLIQRENLPDPPLSQRTNALPRWLRLGGIAKLSERGGDWARRCQLRSHLERIVVPQTEGVSPCVAV